MLVFTVLSAVARTSKAHILSIFCDGGWGMGSVTHAIKKSRVHYPVHEQV